MGTFAVIGETARVSPFALAGATVIAALSPDAVRRAWTELPNDAAVVVLTPEAAEALGDEVGYQDKVLCVVMPR